MHTGSDKISQMQYMYLTIISDNSNNLKLKAKFSTIHKIKPSKYVSW